jgi:NitT/TauT family transport system permease protein
VSANTLGLEVGRQSTARRRQSHAGISIWLVRVGALAVVLAAWGVAANTSRFVPSIGATCQALWDGFADGSFGSGLRATFEAVVLAFVISAGLALVSGVVLGRSRFWGAVCDPIILVLFAVPRFVMYPVFLTIYGVGMTSKIWIGVLSAIFPILINTIAGIRDVSDALVKLGRSVGCGPVSITRKIYLPAALPTVMVGMRLGFCIAFLAIIVAELVAATEGLGLMIRDAYGLQRYPEMFAIVVLVTLVAFGCNLALLAAERRVRGAVE